MTKKQLEELELVKRLLEELGFQKVYPESRDRPDVIAKLGGRRISIEVTIFHADEGTGHKGSALRAKEEKKAKDLKGSSYATWGVPDPLPGIRTRIEEKIKRAETYDNNQYNELWLLIAAQIPNLGAMASTFIIPQFLNAERLNLEFDSLLRQSRFGRVYLYLIMNNLIFEWSLSERWCMYPSHQGKSHAIQSILVKKIIEDPKRNPSKKLVEPNKDGNTLLHFAARPEKTVWLLKEFLRESYDVNAKNNRGETPLDIAERYGNIEAALELIRHDGETGRS